MGALRGVVRLVLVTALLLGMSSATTAAKEIHVDCSAATPGDGTPTSPINEVGSGFALQAGDRLLLRRGTVCTGELRVSGGGSEAEPATVGSYGTGALPKVIGNGRNAVRVEDASHLTVRDLDISNPGSGGPLGEGDQIRNGIRVTAQAGNSRNLTLTGLEVHDVDGDLTKNPEGSAAIQISVTGPPPIRFEDLLIKGNKIDSVSRSAISITGTNDSNRPDGDQPWPAASTGVVVEGNRIDLIAGDGIVPRGTDGAIVRGNVVSRGNLAGRALLDPKGPMCNAGIWAFHANNTLIQGNEVFGMKHNGCDGTGFDVDYRQDGTIIEGNYSHHNEGGFILLCTDTSKHRSDVRFNLSVDDATTINHGPCGFGQGIFGDLSGVRMFNNTVVADHPSVTMQLSPVTEMYEPGDFRFENNLVFARQSTGDFACGENCSNNLFYGLPPSGLKALTSNPLLTGPMTGAEGMSAAIGFRPGPGSPLHGSGTSIPAGATQDFFGNPIPAVPSIGFDQREIKIQPPGPKPDRACQKARTARNLAQRKVRKLQQRVKKMRRKSVKRARIRPVARKLRQARAQAKRKVAAARKTCRPVQL